MRWCRYGVGNEVKGFGLVETLDGQDVVAVGEGTPFTGFVPTGEHLLVEQVRLLAPVVPTKVLCIGKNYDDHIREMGGEAPVDPVIFSKPSTSVIGPGDPIVHPRDSDQVDFEGELAIVIGALCRDVPADRALEVVLGYTVANDVTARDHQRHDGQWTRAKGHDTFCPLGPWITTGVDPHDLAITTELDGELRQSGRTSQQIHDIGALIQWVTSFATLIPGDVLLTGTPAGVGPMRPGQSVSVTIEGLGTLTNPVVAR